MVAGMRTRSSMRVLAAVLLLAPLLGGCAKKSGRGGQGGADGAGLGEEGLATGSSLDRAKRGLSPEEGGILGDVRFSYDSAELDDAAREVVSRNLAWLRDNARAKVELEGHCDSRGTIEYNLGLGAKRTKAVKDYLAGQGIASDRISTISYGKELPVCREETDACRERNRRVHSVVLGQ